MKVSMRHQQIFFVLLFLGAIGFLFYSSFRILSYWPMEETYYWVRIGVCVFSCFLTLKLIHLFAIKSGNSERKKSLILLVFSFIFLFFLFETIFSFVPRSHGGANTLASRLWFHKYWKENSLNFRDTEPFPRAENAIFKIMVVGDSFVEGHGIKDREDRWTNQLASYLPQGVEVFNLGQNGSNTVQQFETLTTFPVHPDLIILSHIPNDIDYLLTSSNLPLNPPPTQAGFLPKIPWGKYSFLFDFFYHKFRNWFYTDMIITEEHLRNGDITGYQQLFLDPEVMEMHITQIDKILDWGIGKQIPVAMIFWGETSNAAIDISHRISSIPIAQHCQSRQIPTFDTYSLLKAIPFKERVVSPLDKHPSVLANHQIGKAMYEFLQKEQLLPIEK